MIKELEDIEANLQLLRVTERRKTPENQYSGGVYLKKPRPFMAHSVSRDEEVIFY